MCKIGGGGGGGGDTVIHLAMPFFQDDRKTKFLTKEHSLNSGDTNLFRKETRPVKPTFPLKMSHTNIAIPAQVFSVTSKYLLLKHFTAVG